MNRFIHFEYTSGANPYIAFTDKRAKEVIDSWKKKGVDIMQISDDRYTIDDKKCMDLFRRII